MKIKAPIMEIPRWNLEKSKFIDEDIIKELKDVSVFYGDIINLQLIKEIRRLIEVLNKEKYETFTQAKK